MVGIDKMTVIDLVAIDNFINLYTIYLDKKRVYDSYVDSVNAHFSINKQNDVVQQIYFKILQLNMKSLNNFLSDESKEEAKLDIADLRRFSSKIKNYKNLLSIFNISESDTFSKFIGYKSLNEIEKEVRNRYKNCTEAFIITTSNEIYSKQDEVLRKNIHELYNELLSVKKYIKILTEYQDKYKNSSYLMSLFAKYTMNKKLKEELNKDSNINFLNLLTKNGDISTFVSDEINKYSKYLLPIAMFTEKVYGDAMDALDKMDENEEEIQIDENVSVINNNSNIQKLRELYTEYGVDSYYLDETSSLWYLNYNEALVKLKFCEDYYMLNNNCSAAGTLFQAEVLYMNSIEFKIKFETDMSDLVDKYIRQEVIVAENSNNVQYRKVM